MGWILRVVMQNVMMRYAHQRSDDDKTDRVKQEADCRDRVMHRTKNVPIIMKMPWLDETRRLSMRDSRYRWDMKLMADGTYVTGRYGGGKCSVTRQWRIAVCLCYVMCQFTAGTDHAAIHISTTDTHSPPRYDLLMSSKLSRSTPGSPRSKWPSP